jgi:hypothetical protein
VTRSLLTILLKTGDDFAETINIYQNGKIFANLQKFKDADSLQSAQTQDGKKVVSDSANDTAVGGVAANLSVLHDAASKDFPPSLSGRTFVSLDTPSAVTNGSNPVLQKKSLSVSHLPANFSVGMKLQSGNWVLSNSTVKPMLAFSLSDSFTEFAGDVWHGLESLPGLIIQGVEDATVKITDGISFVITKVGDGLEFVLTILDKPIRIVLRTFMEVFKAINFVLKLIGIDLTVVRIPILHQLYYGNSNANQILRWLGHLLGWDHIWETHKIFAKTISSKSSLVI